MSTPRGNPVEYQVDVERPADFDDFWRRIRAESDAIPLQTELRHDPLRSTDDVVVYEVFYDSIDGVRIGGWYAHPVLDDETAYPGLILVPGYISEPKVPKDWARRGYATLSVAPRGKLQSNRQFNPGYPGLLVHNITDRNTYSYRGFYVDALRAVDVLQERPEVDSRRIGVHGSSQGGALTVVIAALRNDVIVCGSAGAPYLTAFLDSARLTRSYPYEEINEYLAQFPERYDAVRETLAYFDCINFAPLITCPMHLYIGLVDDVCPPETGYALASAMKHAQVDLFAHEGCAHDAGIYWEQSRIEAFLARHLQPDRRKEPNQ